MEFLNRWAGHSRVFADTCCRSRSLYDSYMVVFSSNCNSREGCVLVYLELIGLRPFELKADEYPHPQSNEEEYVQACFACWDRYLCELTMLLLALYLWKSRNEGLYFLKHLDS